MAKGFLLQKNFYQSQAREFTVENLGGHCKTPDEVQEVGAPQ